MGIALLVALILVVLGLVVAITIVLLWLKMKWKLDFCWCPKCWKPVTHTNGGDEVGHRKHIQPLQVSRSFVDVHQSEDFGYQSTYSVTTGQQTPTPCKALQYSVQDILNAIDPTDITDREDSSMFVSVGSPSCPIGPAGGNTSNMDGSTGLTVADSAPNEMPNNKKNQSSVRSTDMASSNPTLAAVSGVNIELNSVALNEVDHVHGGKWHEIAIAADAEITEKFKRESMLCEIDKEFWGADLELLMFSY